MKNLMKNIIHTTPQQDNDKYTHKEKYKDKDTNKIREGCVNVYRLR